MKALIDGDIILYESAYAAQSIEEVPDWELVESIVNRKIEQICYDVDADSYELFLSSSGSFRHNAYPMYKQNRSTKPIHYANLCSYLLYQKTSSVSAPLLEADDELAIAYNDDPDNCIICTRDKDLRQVPCLLYSWPVYNLPSIGPLRIQNEGQLEWRDGRVLGDGYPWFIYQTLVGDPTDNYGGCPGIGPKKVMKALEKCVYPEDYEKAAIELFMSEDAFKEMASLAWIVRRRGKHWDIGVYE